MGAYDAFPGLGHMERVTFSTQGSCPGALLALVGVHAEVCRTERLRLPSDRVRISLMKLLEFLQSTYRKVVEGFFHPVFSFRIIEPLDEVEDSFVVSSAAFDRGHYFVDIVFLRLLNVISFSQHLRWVRRCSVFAGSVWFEE